MKLREKERISEAMLLNKRKCSRLCTQIQNNTDKNLYSNRVNKEEHCDFFFSMLVLSAAIDRWQESVEIDFRLL